MKIDGIQLSEGSQLSNLTVATATSFPTLPSTGELVYLTSGSVGRVNKILLDGRAEVAVIVH